MSLWKVLCVVAAVFVAPQMALADGGCSGGSCGQPDNGAPAHPNHPNHPQHPPHPQHPGHGGGTNPNPTDEPKPEPEPEPKPVSVDRSSDGPRNAPPAAAGPGEGEYLLAGSAAEIRAAEALAVKTGASILRREKLSSLGVGMLVVDLGGGTLDNLRKTLASNGIKVTVAANTTFKPAATVRVYASDLVGMQSAGDCPPLKGTRIGLIDGPIDLSQPALSGVDITVNRLIPADAKEGGLSHATDLAALIAGKGTELGTGGLAQGSHLFAASVFERSRDGDVARAESIISALEWLVANNVQIANLSLAGPRNDVLAGIIDLPVMRGITMLASVGNDGAREVAFPASDPNVIGITAVDANKRRYAKANIGEGVDFAAPGVDVAVPKGDGATYRTGTSFATAFATAIFARKLAEGGSPANVETESASAEDLGKPGFDDNYGWGLLKISGCKK
jgi:hypothetical protein